MSKLDELIAELCPEGVEYKRIDELAQISAGGDLPENYVKGLTSPSERYPYPIYSNGTADRALYGYADSYKIEKEAITISARGTIGYHEIRKGKFTPIVRLITLIADENIITTKFLNYALCVAGIEGVTTGIPSLTVPMLRKFIVPVPPLPVQNEIVRILDNFTELTTKLTAELTARKKQYEYYRSRLLTSKETVTKWCKLGEIADIGTGSSNTNEALEEGLYPFYVRSQEVRGKNEYEFDEIAIITAGDGVGVGKVFHYVEGKYALHQRAYRIHITNENVVPKYFYHYMKSTFLDYIRKTAVNSSVTSIRRKMLDDYSVPVPSLEVQQRIVNVLDNFESICSDLNIGLPAEIEARKKQYEFYRDALLTFAETGSIISQTDRQA